MNFGSNEKLKKKLLILPNKRDSKGKNKEKKVDTYHKGVYLISRDIDDVCYKMGVAWGAGGLFNRLMPYKIYHPYPTENFVQYLFITATSDDAKKLEKLLLGIKALHKPEGFPDDEKSGQDPREYRIFPSKDVLTNSVMKILNNNYDLWTHAVCLGKKGWKLITNNGEPVKGLVRPRDSMEAQPIPYEPVQAAEEFKYTGPDLSIKVDKGKWVWVVAKKGRGNQFVPLKGRLDGALGVDHEGKDGVFIHFAAKHDPWVYAHDQVFATKAEAEADIPNYL